MQNKVNIISSFKYLWGNRRLKAILGYLILSTTVLLFVYYSINNFGHISRVLFAIGPLLIITLLILYFSINLTNSEILKSSLVILGHNYSNTSSFLLTSYSSIVNFFGPLQSGPGFRAVYLKNKLGVKIFQYTRTLLLYYAIFALVNALIIVMVIAARVGLEYAILALLGFGLAFLIFQKIQNKRPDKNLHFNNAQVFKIVLFVLAQCIITAIIYSLEIWSFNSSVTILQTLGYTAIANLSLFVALTPGAIGIRESFLLFSQQLHGINSDTIIAASVIDRAIYFIFLILLFLLCVALNVNKKLGVKKLI